MLLLRGALKEYAWGRHDGLVQWTAPSGTPQAELWFGAHPSGPSPLIGADGEPTGTVCELPDAPVLVKLLAAGEPLSVQVHPSQAIAEAQWEAQQSGGPQVYADPNEKAELLYAIEPFYAFAGWRAMEQAAAIFAAIDGSDAVCTALRSGDRLAAVRAILELPDHAAMIAQVPAAITDLDPLAQECYARVMGRYPNDVGVLITLLLDTVLLQPGAAIFVPAGVPHSYIDGLGIEVMTASDNVARLGLTEKPVFTEHALTALNPDGKPEWLAGDVLHTPVGFDMQIITDTTRELPAGDYRVVLAVEGDVHVDDIALPIGVAAVCTAPEPVMRIRASGTAALITAGPRRGPARGSAHHLAD